jgi:hypothetical protein
MRAGPRRRFHCVARETWREQFERFARSLRGAELYVSVDLDCLRAEEAVTDWESGLFTAADVAWAIRALRDAGCAIAAGDVCGAHSPARFARLAQRAAARFDRPRASPPRLAEAQRVNVAALSEIWPALSGEPRFNAPDAE